MSDSEPPRRTFELKPKTFTSLNAPPGSAEPRIDVRDHLATANAPRRAGPEAGVSAAREAVRSAEPLRETPVMTGWTPRRSRRKRHYLILAIVGALCFGLAGYWAHGRSPLIFTTLMSLLALYQAALAWLMWQIIDDY